jgi:toxin CcdB
MAQHDVYLTSQGEYLLDCQSDFLNEFNTRFVVPLLDPEDAPETATRLNPAFEVDGRTLVMYTQFASSVPAVELKQRVASLQEHRYDITNALDTLTGSF